MTSYGDILNDPDIDCVVELMGGITHAKDVVFGAITANKHVVTANKALIANFLPGTGLGPLHVTPDSLTIAPASY